MRNIYLLPTDKPSRLFIYNGILGISKDDKIIDLNNYILNQNIYITSDEEIKEGDWVKNISFEEPIFKVDAKGFTYVTLLPHLKFKKVVLTDNQDLIKDGVQEIDDEFLEWFVKNPTCESVEVEKTFVTNSGLGYQEYAVLNSDFKVLEVVANKPQSSYQIGEVTKLDAYEYVTTYKIIIPKEEPKIELYIPKYTIGNEPTNEQEEPKQETTADYIDRHLVQALVGVAKQERMYSEEDMIEFAEWIADSKLHGYPKQLYEAMIRYKVKTTKELLKVWFEQFKKK